MSRYLNKELEIFFDIAQKLETVDTKNQIKLKFMKLSPGNNLNIVLECPFELREKVKQAGFCWNGDLRVWHYEFDSNFTKKGYDSMTDEQKELFEKDRW